MNPSRIEIFWDFKRFLSTEKVEIVGQSKTDLLRYYTNDYVTYKQQISPDVKLPSYSSVIQNVYKAGIAQYDTDGKLVILSETSTQTPNKKHNKPRRRSKAKDSPKVEDKTQTGHVAEGSSNDAGGKTKPVMKKTRVAVDQHMTFKGGLPKIVNEESFQGDPEEWKYVGRIERGYYCTLCQSKLTSTMDAKHHLAGKRHRLALSVSLIQSKKEKLIAGLSTVKVTADVPETGGTYCINVQEQQVKKVDISITNTGKSIIELVHCEMMKKVRVFTLRDSKKVTDGMNTATILPGEVYKVQVTVKATHVGNYHCPVMFHFIQHANNLQQSGYILRYLHCKCSNSEIDDMRPNVQYKRPPRVNRQRGNGSRIVPGYALPSRTGDRLERVLPLDNFPVPPNVRKMINRGLIDTHGLSEAEIQEMEKLTSILEGELCMSTYSERFRSLLYFEEIQMEVDIRKYDMENVSMRVCPSNSRLVLLEVPGLSENRPSVLRGDWLYVTIHDAEGHPINDTEYQGYVHEVQQNEVALGFDKSFRDAFIDKQKFSVRFVFNRLPSKLQHRACQLVSDQSLGNLLFPTEISPSIQIPQLSLFNRSLEGNAEQKCAVQHIVAGTSKPAPYIIFGPPGTGKTVTIVEAMKQVWKCSKSSCILACTPSNSAADLIAKRVMEHIPKNEILRINASSRSWGSVPEAIKCICNYNRETSTNYFPSKAELAQYRVIITTLVTSGRLVSAKFPAEHFSHIFLDEAGHAPEPEALIPVAGLMQIGTVLKPGGQVVIAGDPKQLGPILRSPLAIKYGMDLSILERYMDSCNLYRPADIDGGRHKQYDVRVITKLLNNYRSHPAILELPNEMFYNTELKPCADKMEREKLCHWDGLPKKGFPLLFHGMIGEDMREERSPSFFNPQEVSTVVKYVEDLMACQKGGIKLKQGDIGVISPYRKQVQKIQQLLRKKKLDKISVGSVEEFQGQERTVIIVSTVRSKPEYMSFDMKFQLGFLRNPKRFNVTVTRAKALLIVVGNPHTLSGDPQWKQLIDYCEDNGAYIGTERMNEDDEIEDLIQRLTAVELIDDKYRLIPEIQSDYNDQAWRSDI